MATQQKKVSSRIIPKHDIESNWNKATNFVPLKGEIIVYDADENYSYPRVKHGDGVTNVNELPFREVQVDWDQNDNTKVDYIKNKPFYEETIDTTHFFVEDKEVEVDPNNIEDNMHWNGAKFTELTIGELYNVKIKLTKADGSYKEVIYTGIECVDTANLYDIKDGTCPSLMSFPEGLPAVVTVILSIGVTAMSKRNALIRKLTAVETLGCTQIICSDKTGTLTQNKMTVVDTFTNDVHLLATGMALCSDAKIDPEKKQAVGEPTEAALVNFAYKHDLPSYTLIEQQPRVGEAPFDSMRKMMSTVHKYKDGYIQYTKGANEIVLSHCDYYLDENHQVVKLTEEVKTEITHKAKEYADRALRVLGLGYRLYEEKPANFDSENLENDLIYVGFTGMIDPCRDEVYDAIKECESAGIRPVMITGDHIDTAVAIGKDLGIITDASQAMLGSQLDSLTDEQLKEVVQKTSVFARVQPEHKTRIVRAFKDLGNVVAMTGDGVNDAPSIKAADIGVGMGITGTDVTKSVADMVLADDNFATIVNAVEEGRKINDNVRKVLQFQISSNMTEVLVVFISSIFALEVLSPTHLLWINMVTDSLPGLALGMEKAEEGVMKRKPRPSNESVFSNGAGLDIVLQGIYMATIILTSFFIGYKMDGHLNGMTMAFLTINLAELFHAISMRTQRGSLIKLKTFNWWLFGALTLTFLLNIALIYVPAFEVLFDFAPINFTEFMIALALAFSVLPVLEVYKFVMRTIDKKKNK